MGIFDEYFKKKTGQENPTLGNLTLGKNSPLYNTDVAAGLQPTGKPQGTVTPNDVPKIDKKNPISSMAQILGPTPEEQKAEQDRLQAHNRKMQGWATLFNGLRHLGNLYYTARGATPQVFNDPNKILQEQQVADEQRQAAYQKQRQQYNKDLLALERQAEADKRAQAKLDSDTRYREFQIADLISKGKREDAKLELQKLEAEARAAGQKARAEYYAAQIADLEAQTPYKIARIQAQTNASNSSAAASRARAADINRRAGGTTTTKRKIDENTTETTVTPVGSGRTPASNGKKKKGKKINW